VSEKGAPAELNVTVHYFMISESYDVSDHLSDAFLERRSFTIGFQRNSRMRRSRWTKRCSPSFDAFGKLSLILITCIVLSCPVLSCPLLSCLAVSSILSLVSSCSIHQRKRRLRHHRICVFASGVAEICFVTQVTKHGRREPTQRPCVVHEWETNIICHV
jgi:hypothetical protein